MHANDPPLDLIGSFGILRVQLKVIVTVNSATSAVRKQCVASLVFMKTAQKSL